MVRARRRLSADGTVIVRYPWRCHAAVVSRLPPHDAVFRLRIFGDRLLMRWTVIPGHKRRTLNLSVLTSWTKERQSSAV